MSKQLADVARLLARDRRPYCPANGLVWLLPASALDGNRAESTAAAIRADRRALDSVWQLDLPQTVCIVNAETVPGFRELAGSIPASARAERSLGVTFPARPATSQVQAITDHIAWLTNGLVAGLAVHRLGGDDFMAARAAWRCAAWWAERGPRLSRLVTDGLPDADGRAALVTGVHLCATGADSSDHAFAAAPADRGTRARGHRRLVASGPPPGSWRATAGRVRLGRCRGRAHRVGLARAELSQLHLTGSSASRVSIAFVSDCSSEIGV